MIRHQDVDESENRQPGSARSDPHLALLQDLGRVLAEATSEHDALSLIVERICTGLHWEYGACWKEDEHVTLEMIIGNLHRQPCRLVQHLVDGPQQRPPTRHSSRLGAGARSHRDDTSLSSRSYP